jgi:hypothetical protein
MVFTNNNTKYVYNILFDFLVPAAKTTNIITEMKTSKKIWEGYV